MFSLAPLPFAANALAPYIDEETVLIHHDKHHAAYVNKLNDLLAPFPEFANLSTDSDLIIVMKNLDKFPENLGQAIFNNAGQVYNHNLYWQSLTDSESSQKFQMSKGFADQIDKFETYENFQKLWREAGLNQFGSGWVWLVLNSEGNLLIQKTANGDNPIFNNSGTPLMVMDVWEHAYYLKYQNKRAEYIDNFFQIIDWAKVSGRYDEMIK